MAIVTHTLAKRDQQPKRHYMIVRRVHYSWQLITQVGAARKSKTLHVLTN
jgi:hypothetical protein